MMMSATTKSTSQGFYADVEMPNEVFDLINEFLDYGEAFVKTAQDKLKVIVAACKHHKMDDTKIRKILDRIWEDLHYSESYKRKLLSEKYPELINDKFANKNKAIKIVASSSSQSHPQQTALPQNIVEVMDEKEKGDDTDKSKPKFFDMKLLSGYSYGKETRYHIVKKKVNRQPEYVTSGTFVKCDQCGMFAKVSHSGFGKEGWDIKDDAIPLVPSNKYYYDTFWYCRRCYNNRNEK